MIKPTREEFLDFSSLDDDMLLHLIAARQVEGLSSFYDRYSPFVYNYVRSAGYAAEQAAQLTEEVFLKIFTIKEEDIPTAATFSDWLEDRIRECLPFEDGQSAAEWEVSPHSADEKLPFSIKEHLLEQARAFKAEKRGKPN